MRVLLVIPNFGGKDSYFLPLGIMYISSYLKKQGHDVYCLNLNHYSFSKLDEVLRENCFDVVGTGGLFVHIAPIRSVINAVREFDPKIKIILGGAITADPEFIIDELKPDFLILGEGEVATDNLLNAIENRTSINEVTGIAFKENGRFIKTEPNPRVEDLDRLSFPDYEGFEFGHYLEHYQPEDPQCYCSARADVSNRRIAFILSSRDCICKCTFCFRLMGGVFRERSLTNVLNEINYLIDKYQINEIALVDDMFCANKERAREFCKALKTLGFPWQCQIRVTSVDAELLKEFKEAGCHLVSYGFESGSKTVLKSMKKGITPEQIEQAIEGSIKAKLTIQGNFIFGDPAETIETMTETIKFSRKFEKVSLGFGFVVPYPGTILYQRLSEQGKLTDRLKFHENPADKLFNMTSISDIDYKYLLRKVMAEGYRRKKICSGKIMRLKKVKEMIYDINIRCHFCGGVNEGCRLNLEKGNFIICKHCYQRTRINLADLRFHNVPRIIKEFYHLYVMSIFVLTPRVHRQLSSLMDMLGLIKKYLNKMHSLSKANIKREQVGAGR